MCFQVYLGSNEPCVEIPYAERSDDRALFPNCYSIKLFVNKHPERSGFLGAVVGFTTVYQYHLGIMPCGCGFSLDHPANGWADDGWTLNNHRQLNEYVARCLQDVTFCET